MHKMDIELQKDIEAAMNLVKRRFYISDDFKQYNSIYAFTNENLNSYYPKLNIKNKSILTVAGSGDHIFDAYLRGATSIESFDINNLTKYYIELKQAAVKTLEYDEFIRFFCKDFGYHYTLHYTIYKKIRKKLKEKDIIFWDSLYSKWEGKKIRQSHLFYSTEEILPFLKEAVLYLNPKYYMKLKEKLKNKEAFNQENFKNININTIINHYSETFDIIILSNIADYLHEFSSNNNIESFKNWIENEVTDKLNKNGILCVAYLFWTYFEKRKDIPLINQKTILDKYFSNHYEQWTIDNSFIEDTTNDKILIYHKK